MPSKKLFIVLNLIVSAMPFHTHASMIPVDSKQQEEYTQLQQDTGNILLEIFPQEIFGIIGDYSQGYFEEEEVIPKPQARYPLHKKSVTCLLALPSNNILSGSEDKTIKEFNPVTGKIVRTYFPQGWVTCLCPTGDGGFLSGAYDKTMREWTAGDNGGLKATYQGGHKQAVTCVTVLKDGTFLSGSRDGSIVAWNPKTQKMIRPYNGHTESITALHPLEDGNFRSESNDKTRKEWNAATGQIKSSDKTLKRFMIPLKSGTIVTTNGNKVIEINGTTGEKIRTYGRQVSDITNMILLSSGNIISSAANGAIIEWDTTRGRVARVYHDPGNKTSITSLLALPSGSFLAGSDDGAIREWDPNPKSSAELAFEKHQATAAKTAKPPFSKKDGQ